MDEIDEMIVAAQAIADELVVLIDDKVAAFKTSDPTYPASMKQTILAMALTQLFVRDEPDATAARASLLSLVRIMASHVEHAFNKKRVN